MGKSPLSSPLAPREVTSPPRDCQLVSRITPKGAHFVLCKGRASACAPKASRKRVAPTRLQQNTYDTRCATGPRSRLRTPAAARVILAGSVCQRRTLRRGFDIFPTLFLE